MTIHIHRIELREVRLPLREPFRICTERRILLLELHDTDGMKTQSQQ